MKTAFNRALLKWYEENKREMPWRKTQDPYAIWISEIMAQQTRIASVMPYYERFMKHFPRVEDLAAAETDQVLKLWEGLGYYARAHNLQKAARLITTEWGGRFPSDEKELLSLPGVGAYTVGAILSISFGQPVPAVDGNVLRVMTRLYDLSLDITQSATKAEITRRVKALIPEETPGAFTQAMMELGALICVPKKPVCEDCPVAFLCKAREAGTQQTLPIKSPKKALKQIEKTILLVVNESEEVLMRQRKDNLLHGLWEFYDWGGRPGAEEVKALISTWQMELIDLQPLGKASHTFTHLLWEMEGYLCRVCGKESPAGWRFVSQQERKTLAIPTALGYYNAFLVPRSSNFKSET